MIMPLLISIIGLVVIILIIHLIKFIYLKNRIEVRSVKAGPTQEHIGGCCIEPYHISAFDTFYHNGKKLNPKNFTVARVDGDCMAIRGIKPGNIIFIRPLTDEEKNFNKGDILYIKYTRNNFQGYKIREFDGMKDKNSVNTVYYSAEGNVKRSSTPHELANIEGIVVYNFKV